MYVPLKLCVIHLCKIYDQTLEALCDPSVYLDLDLFKEAGYRVEALCMNHLQFS